ncbi:MGMT family protein [Candidatus Pacearchaeota archaeon]|nr:MGMT family protein [Candidatus Pacearchaeota archaeon]
MTKFNEKCYSLLKTVPKGKVTTYKAMAAALNTKAYRAIGNAMNRNPFAPEVPCHRVVKSTGEIGGYALGVKNKIKLLNKEGIEVLDDKVDLDKYLHKF